MKREIVLGRISEIGFGFCGYQDVQLGFFFELSGIGWGVQTNWATWLGDPPPRAQWTTAERDAQLVLNTSKMAKLLKDAGVRKIQDLVDVPIEATFDDKGSLTSWRILTEVLK